VLRLWERVDVVAVSPHLDSRNATTEVGSGLRPGIGPFEGVPKLLLVLPWAVRFWGWVDAMVVSPLLNSRTSTAEVVGGFDPAVGFLKGVPERLFVPPRSVSVRRP
jgi:hypothetical protein